MDSQPVVTVGDKVTVKAPYHPRFVSRAKGLGGKWSPSKRAWEFDVRDEDAVRRLCRDVYGTDGDDNVPLVTVRYTITSVDADKQSLYKFGRLIARRRGRDIRVSLGDGVVIVEGKFAPTGGSAKYPAIGGEGVVLEVRDVPATLAEGGEVVEFDRAQIEKRIQELCRKIEKLKGLLDGQESVAH